MDPRITEIYGQDPHSVTWWVIFLTIATVLTFVLIGVFLIGVTKAYAPSTDEALAPEPIPLDGADEATPEAVEPAAATDLAGVG